jgi:hypothetical protein
MADAFKVSCGTMQSMQMIQPLVDRVSIVSLNGFFECGHTAARMIPILAAQIARRFNARLAAITAAQPPRSR